MFYCGLKMEQLPHECKCLLLMNGTTFDSTPFQDLMQQQSPTSDQFHAETGEGSPINPVWPQKTNVASTFPKGPFLIVICTCVSTISEHVSSHNSATHCAWTPFWVECLWMFQIRKMSFLQDSISMGNLKGRSKTLECGPVSWVICWSDHNPCSTVFLHTEHDYIMWQ